MKYTEQADKEKILQSLDSFLRTNETTLSVVARKLGINESGLHQKLKRGNINSALIEVIVSEVNNAYVFDRNTLLISKTK